MTDIKYVITEHIGTLSKSEKGWTKELNLVSWNDAEPKYDLRQWSPDHSKMGKGIGLNESELTALLRLLTNRVGICDDKSVCMTAVDSSEEKPMIRVDGWDKKTATSKRRSTQITGATPVFFCKSKDAIAYGKISFDGKGFIVLAGSKIVRETTPSFSNNARLHTYYENRQTMIADGTIRNFEFTKDVEFSSPSAASSIILGKSSNGNKDWKLEDGKTLGDVI